MMKSKKGDGDEKRGKTPLLEKPIIRPRYFNHINLTYINIEIKNFRSLDVISQLLGWKPWREPEQKFGIFILKR